MSADDSLQKTKNKSPVSAYARELGVRISKVADLVGGKAELSRRMEVHESNLYRYINGVSAISADLLVKLSNVSEISLKWLATGEGSICEEKESEYIPNEDEYAYIPLYNIETSAGYGAFVDHEEVVDHLAFKHSWIHSKLHCSKKDLSLVYVVGDSMEPTLKNDDIIMVDQNENSKRLRDGIFVIRIDGELFVKRIQRIIGNTIEITSDNPEYKPFKVHLDQLGNYDFAVIGRVVWVGRRT